MAYRNYTCHCEQSEATPKLQLLSTVVIASTLRASQ